MQKEFSNLKHDFYYKIFYTNFLVKKGQLIQSRETIIFFMSSERKSEIKIFTPNMFGSGIQQFK